MSKPFQLKQFLVVQEQSAMKVGCDGMLLGAWAAVADCPSCLDLGSGTGLIALMLAQRNPQAAITAIEQEDNAYAESLFNFQQSPFTERIVGVHADFLQWDNQQLFQHVVSNPPFFTENTAASEKNRSQARQAQHLPLSLWIPKAKSMLAPEGKISFIYPAQEQPLLRQVISENQLHMHRLCWVKPIEHKAAHRVLIELRQSPCPSIIVEKICIRQAKGSSYHESYQALTKDFYLGL